MPQGWNGSPHICNNALHAMFSVKVLQEFISLQTQEIQELFPYRHFGAFLTSFVDDLAISTKVALGDVIHFLAIESVLYALERGGWLISLRKSTIMNP